MSRTQLWVGVVLIALGVVLLVDQAGLADASSVIGDWWPLVAIVAGFAQVATRPRNPVGATVWVVIGVTLLLWTQGAVRSPVVLWPVLLIGIGLWLLVGRPRSARTSDAASVDASAIFDDREVRAPSGLFTGGSLTTVLGDLRVDLRRAEPVDGATLQVTTILGDVRIEVPTHWRVAVSGPELLGDVNVSPEVGTGPGSADGAPTLRLRVLTLLGDVTVRGAPSEPGAGRQ